MRNKFSEIESPLELVSYLQEPQRFNNVKNFCKYMSLSSVYWLFSEHKLLINNPTKMNDFFEIRAFGKGVNWNKICFASFITQSTENMAMWGMYAQPWTEGVMISIPYNAIRELMQDTHMLITVDQDKSGRFIPTDKTLSSDGILSLSRVAYTDGTTITCTGRNDRNRNFHNAYKNPALAGYIKDVAWEYEKEVRIRVDLPETYSQKAVYIYLPDDLLKQITITTGPRFEGNVLKSLPEEFRPFVTIEASKFTEKLAWIPCDDCNYKKSNR